MNTEEQERLAATVGALRPDWTNGLPDRLRSLRSFVADHYATRPFRDALLEFVACAADPATVSPGRVLTAGPWRNAPRTTSDLDRTTAAEHRDQLGRQCVCGAWEAHHTGARVQDCPGFTPARDQAPADPAYVARLRARLTERTTP